MAAKKKIKGQRKSSSKKVKAVSRPQTKKEGHKGKAASSHALLRHATKAMKSVAKRNEGSVASTGSMNKKNHHEVLSEIRKKQASMMRNNGKGAEIDKVKSTESVGNLFSDKRKELMKKVKDDVVLLRKEDKKDDKKKRDKGKPILERARLNLYDKLNLSGYDPELSERFARAIFNFTVFVTLIVSLFVIRNYFVSWNKNFFSLFFNIAMVWIFVFLIVLGVLWIVILFYFEMKIYQRQKQIEEIFPQYLQLTSSNIRSGMTIDMALWHAIKPKFGILAFEMEYVAKAVMAGSELTDALQEFSSKYKSDTVRRSVALIIEGINAGGEIGDLLNQISLDLMDNQIMRKEMSADVTTYVIFISFATILAAPFLYALAYNLIAVIQNIMGTLDMSSTTSMGGFGSGMGGDSAIKLEDFRTFAILSLCLTSTMTSIIIATIKRGNAKECFHYLPYYIAVSIVIYFVGPILKSTQSIPEPTEHDSETPD